MIRVALSHYLSYSQVLSEGNRLLETSSNLTAFEGKDVRIRINVLEERYGNENRYRFPVLRTSQFSRREKLSCMQFRSKMHILRPLCKLMAFFWPMLRTIHLCASVSPFQKSFSKILVNLFSLILSFSPLILCSFLSQLQI